jgi:hypothetical protein
MRRTIPLLLLGLACGAPHAQSVLPEHASVAERASFYAGLANSKSPADLQQLARKAAALPAGPMQRFQIEAVLDRYFELDRQGALRLAGELRRSGGVDALPALYERLARADANAALSALSLIDDPAEERSAALAIVQALGDDAKALELVAATLHGVDAEQFRAEALQRLAQKSPRAAFEGALALRDPARRNSLAQWVVGQWASRAPADALAAADRIGDPALRKSVRYAVLAGWSDIGALSAYVDRLDPAEQRELLTDGVLARLIQADPAHVAALAADLPPSEDRRRALLQIAASYADKDAEAALAWAQELAAQDPMLVTSVLASAARHDPARAFDMAASLAEPARSQAMLTVVGSIFAAEPRDLETLAGRIVRMPDGGSKTQLVSALVNSWASRPGGAAPALRWMLANPSAVPPAAFEEVAFAVAQADPAAAASYLDRVPSAARGSWIGAVAAGYARSDPQAGVAFLERFRGDPAYGRAALMLAPQLAVADPPAAARMLESVGAGGPESFSVAAQIGSTWAARDPAAAAAWAIDLPEQQRNIALQTVSMAWGASDPNGLRGWALGLPSGAKRDTALAAALRAPNAAAADPELLAAFSDDRARQVAVMTSLVRLAATDAPAAHRLVETYVTDPRLRTQAEQMIDMVPRGVMPTPAGVVRLQMGASPVGPAFVAPTVAVESGVAIGRIAGPLASGPTPAGTAATPPASSEAPARREPR